MRMARLATHVFARSYEPGRDWKHRKLSFVAVEWTRLQARHATGCHKYDQFRTNVLF